MLQNIKWNIHKILWKNINEIHLIIELILKNYVKYMWKVKYKCYKLFKQASKYPNLLKNIPPFSVLKIFSNAVILFFEIYFFKYIFMYFVLYKIGFNFFSPNMNAKCQYHLINQLSDPTDLKCKFVTCCIFLTHALFFYWYFISS